MPLTIRHLRSSGYKVTLHYADGPTFVKPCPLPHGRRLPGHVSPGSGVLFFGSDRDPEGWKSGPGEGRGAACAARHPPRRAAGSGASEGPQAPSPARGLEPHARRRPPTDLGPRASSNCSPQPRLLGSRILPEGGSSLRHPHRPLFPLVPYLVGREERVEESNPGEKCRGGSEGGGKWPRVSSVSIWAGVSKPSVSSRRCWAGAATGCLLTLRSTSSGCEREAISTLACSTGWGEWSWSREGWPGDVGPLTPRTSWTPSSLHSSLSCLLPHLLLGRFHSTYR